MIFAYNLHYLLLMHTIQCYLLDKKLLNDYILLYLCCRYVLLVILMHVITIIKLCHNLYKKTIFFYAYFVKNSFLRIPVMKLCCKKKISFGSAYKQRYISLSNIGIQFFFYLNLSKLT